MDIQIRAEIPKVEPAMTAGKDEARRKFIKVKLSASFDHDLAEQLQALGARQLLHDGDAARVTIGIDRLTLKATFKGIARGLRKGTQVIVLQGVKATARQDGEDGQLSVDLVFNAEYSEDAMVFLSENVKNTVDVKLQTVQPALAAKAAAASRNAASDEGEKQEAAPAKPKKGKAKKDGAPKKPRRPRAAAKPDEASDPPPPTPPEHESEEVAFS